MSTVSCNPPYRDVFTKSGKLADLDDNDKLLLLLEPWAEASVSISVLCEVSNRT